MIQDENMDDSSSFETLCFNNYISVRNWYRVCADRELIEQGEVFTCTWCSKQIDEPRWSYGVNPHCCLKHFNLTLKLINSLHTAKKEWESEEDK